MPKVPRKSGREVVRAFEKAGFSIVRIKGSHHILKMDGHPKLLSIPVHGNDDVGLGLLKAQISAAGLTVEKFIKLLG